MDPKKFDFIMFLAIVMLVAFWGLILGILVSDFLDSDTHHWLRVHLARALRALGELYN